MLNLQFFHTRTYPYYPKQVPYSRAQRFPTWAYASQHNIQTAATPREVLGVSQDADIKEIKTAFRKLALKYAFQPLFANPHFLDSIRIAKQDLSLNSSKFYELMKS